MAIETGTPLIPVAIWGTQRIWTKGRPRNLRRRGIPVTIVVGEPIPVAPGDDLALVTQRLHDRLREMLTHAQDEYPDKPAGEQDNWWQPARLGGGAPTVEESRRMDAEDYENR
jgi:1-acyl-sn-glycerol-3-phosphate acyltransferase